MTKVSKEESKEWSRLAANLHRHISSMQALRDVAVSQRQQRGLGGSPSQGPISYHMDTLYEQKIDGYGRHYSQGLSFQAMTRRMRNAIQIHDTEDPMCGVYTVFVL